MKKLIRLFFYKNEKPSKTAVILSLATFIMLFLWPFQSLFAGTEFFGWWTIPEFSPSAATAVLGSLSALYLVNHGWVNKTSDLTKVREEIDKIAEAVRGDK